MSGMIKIVLYTKDYHGDSKWKHSATIAIHRSPLKELDFWRMEDFFFLAELYLYHNVERQPGTNESIYM